MMVSTMEWLLILLLKEKLQNMYSCSGYLWLVKIKLLIFNAFLSVLSMMSS